MSALTPLESLYSTDQGIDLPLPAELDHLYGRFRLPRQAGKPHVIANFVTSLDGVVALDMSGLTGGGDIGGFDPHDKMVMGLLRAIADVAIVGAGTLRAAPNHVWTADHICPELAGAYAELRASLGKTKPPLNVVVSANGVLDLEQAVFQSGKVQALILTTRAGESLLRTRELPPWLQIKAIGEASPLSAQAILRAVQSVRPIDVALVEGGPRLLGHMLAEQCMDELFLTLAPQIAGRDGSTERLGLVSGKLFAPEHPLWETLISVKRAGSHLFLRYALPSTLAGATPATEPSA